MHTNIHLLWLMLLGNTIQVGQAAVAEYQRCLFTDQRVCVSINLNNAQQP